MDALLGSVDWYSIGVFFLKIDPSFEARFIYIAFILASLLILNGVARLSRDRGRKKGRVIKRDEPKKGFLYKWRMKRWERKAGRPPIMDKILKEIKLYNIYSGLAVIIIVAGTLLQRPFLIESYPVNGAFLETTSPEMRVTFDIPVNRSTIQFNVSPEVSGKWEAKEILPGFDLAREFTFVPEESFTPDSPVVVYVAGIKPPWGIGKEHEVAIDAFAPAIPEITKVSPNDGQQEVAVNTNVNISLDAPTGDFLKWDFYFEPSVEGVDVTYGKKTIKISFPQGLLQDQEYKLSMYRTPRTYLVDSGEDLQVGEAELVKEISFSTVTTPLVETNSPKGESVLINEKISVVFDQKMNRSSVEEHFSMTPEIEGQITWEDDKTFLFTPTETLIKNTNYTVTFSAGMESKAQGKVEKDVVLKFKTIGYVLVSSTVPLNGGTGYTPSTTNVSIAFNQEVNKQSAQDHFFIYPGVSGGFSWSGNTMTYSTAGKLGYSSSYTVTLKQGIESVNGLDSKDDYKFVFTTKDNVVAFTIPWYAQSESFTCNLAASRMALAYRGVYVSENQIRNSIGYGQNPNSSWVNGYGTHAGPIGSYISGYRGVSVRSGMSMAELTTEVNKGNPVIVWVYNRYSQPYGAFTLSGGYTGYKGMHSEVVRGYIGDPISPTYILTNDPWRGRLTYSKSTFLGIWSYLGYSAVVVK